MKDIFEKFYNNLNDGVYSVMDISVEVLTPTDLMSEETFAKNYETIYLNSVYVENTLKHNQGIFKHPSGFYLCLSRKGVTNVFTLKVIYKFKQYEEVKVFINALKKIKK
jgi:hypothetical protein